VVEPGELFFTKPRLSLNLAPSVQVPIARELPTLDFLDEICLANEYTMNRNTFSNYPIVALALIAMAGLFGCASLAAHNTESLLSASGFRTQTPSTPTQIAMFNRMVPYRVERRVRAGKLYYTYADKQNNLVYIGGESEYQRYKQLGQQQSIAQSRLEFSQIDEPAELYNSPIF
jgi:hypothetical protein